MLLVFVVLVVVAAVLVYRTASSTCSTRCSPCSTASTVLVVLPLVPVVLVGVPVVFVVVPVVFVVVLVVTNTQFFLGVALGCLLMRALLLMQVWGACEGYLTLDCWGITFVKRFHLKATLPRACMILEI